jgi:hypothetical protein
MKYKYFILSINETNYNFGINEVLKKVFKGGYGPLIVYLIPL